MRISALCDDPVGLPPYRDAFDHRIILQYGLEPVSKSPYRYPSVKRMLLRV